MAICFNEIASTFLDRIDCKICFWLKHALVFGIWEKIRDNKKRLKMFYKFFIYHIFTFIHWQLGMMALYACTYYPLSKRLK